MRALHRWAVVLLASGCVHYTFLSPADLAARGTRTYPGISASAAQAAAASALGSLGYQVTLNSPETGVVKSAPREILATASTETTVNRSALTNTVNGATSQSELTRDELAWTLKVTEGAGGATVLATPRAYRNGAELTEDAFVAEVMDPRFQALFKELDDSLGIAPR